MKIFGISDLHFDIRSEKPMSVFGKNWERHEERILENWKQMIGENDLILLPGDLSWAMHLREAVDHLKLLDDLPGIKCIGKGNHDYWWESLSKMNQLAFKSIHFIHNTSYKSDSVGIYGTRGWTSEDSQQFDEHDEKIVKRELQRLALSLEQVKTSKTRIAMLHYPPFSFHGELNEFGRRIVENGTEICIYGHLHAEGHRFVREGKWGGTSFYCVSSDYLQFVPRLLKEIEG